MNCFLFNIKYFSYKKSLFKALYDDNPERPKEKHIECKFIDGKNRKKLYFSLIFYLLDIIDTLRGKNEKITPEQAFEKIIIKLRSFESLISGVKGLYLIERCLISEPANLKKDVVRETCKLIQKKLSTFASNKEYGKKI